MEFEGKTVLYTGAAGGLGRTAGAAARDPRGHGRLHRGRRSIPPRLNKPRRRPIGSNSSPGRSGSSSARRLCFRRL